MNKLNWIIPLLCIAPSILQPAFAIESKSELEYAKQVVVRDTNKAITKKLAKAATYIAELDNLELKQKAMEQIREALLTLENNPQAADQFVEGIKRMSQSGADKLKQLVQNKRVQAFAQVVLDESSSSLHGASENSLKKLIGLSDDGIDQAGKQTLNTFSEIDAIVANKGKVPAQLTEKLTDAIKQLPPSRAQAARKLVADKLKGAWQPIREHIGTAVDGGFVLWDAYNIVVSADSAEEKAAKATGTAVGYGLEASGGLAIQALGGGFLHGLVLSWSAGKVNELVAEIILLQQDRANAAEKERWADIELRMDVIRGMIRVDELIKAGELQKASNYLAKVQKFYFKHQMPGDGLYEKMQELEHNIDNAGRLQQANAIIAEARIPYMEGFQRVRQGRNLMQALTYVEDAQQILKKSLRDYPELKTTLEKVEALQAFINKLINNASPLGKLAVDGPDTVKAGAHETYEISVSGGIPDYITTNIEGLALSTGAFAYWQAPDEPGKTIVTFKIKDNIGQTASVEKQITVIGDVPETNPTDTTSGEVIQLEGASTVNLKLLDMDYAEVEHTFVYLYRSVEDDSVIEWDFGDGSKLYRHPANHGSKQPSGEWRSSIMQKYSKTGTFQPVVRLLDGSGKVLGQSSIQITIQPEHVEYLSPPAGLIPEGDN
ncbi:hypothetical protein [Thiothrix winogradskyi]|uniref:PKD domain-containing protein n=1 Tax=Thiothrix winogradskyi TaxID=96472 RepID=A0ABY3SXK8_9GAMM|nr:hypothetical protein [Thiothrix winogradskyi]UJS24178.1 hypothetical protein L2Y54_19950 [Thiothrix winogradskyi]